ncbi:uncharacterized protein LOC108604105 [Drosophila busckii]|uniref:uncharacterized protein LOC108604105 n=1 Tax=Drosophila busckii TaxID=30019 RepID=UPI00083E9A25|nr:uncharacterized protein LOC108604105 [Drosophila busckii]
MKDNFALLQWINSMVSSPHCHKLQDLSNGVILCRLMGKLQPDSIASVLIINRPGNTNEALHNFMLLQSACTMCQINWSWRIKQLTAGNEHELRTLAKRLSRLTRIRLNLTPATLPNSQQQRCFTRVVAGQQPMSLSAESNELQESTHSDSLDLPEDESTLTTKPSIELLHDLDLEQLLNRQRLQLVAQRAAAPKSSSQADPYKPLKQRKLNSTFNDFEALCTCRSCMQNAAALTF